MSEEEKSKVFIFLFKNCGIELTLLQINVLIDAEMERLESTGLSREEIL